MTKQQLLRIATSSDPNSVAGAICAQIKYYGYADLQAIGAGALNQAAKSIIVSKRHLVPQGIDVVCVPEFVNVLVDGHDKTAIRIRVEPR